MTPEAAPPLFIVLTQVHQLHIQMRIGRVYSTQQALLRARGGISRPCDTARGYPSRRSRRLYKTTTLNPRRVDLTAACLQDAW